ncbi:hypothetical protein V8C37DRAFT_365496 [Trichoderma ceciliae]
MASPSLFHPPKPFIHSGPAIFLFVSATPWSLRNPPMRTPGFAASPILCFLKAAIGRIGTATAISPCLGHFGFSLFYYCCHPPLFSLPLYMYFIAPDVYILVHSTCVSVCVCVCVLVCTPYLMCV